jgi:hypothetical protein
VSAGAWRGHAAVAAPIALAAAAACGQGTPPPGGAAAAGGDIPAARVDGGAWLAGAGALSAPDGAAEATGATAAAAGDGPAPGMSGTAPGAADPGSGATVLAAGRATPAGIAVDADSVYWIELGASPDAGAAPDARVLKCAKTGCDGAPTVLASGQGPGMSRIVAAGGRVYWFSTGRVLSCATSGCGGAPTVLWSGAIQPADLAVDDSGVYFTDIASLSVLRCPLDGCPSSPEALWQGPDGGFPAPPVGLALDAARIYFTVVVDGAVYACPRSGCASGATLLAAGRAPRQVVATGAGLFFIDAAGMGKGRLVVLPNAADGAPGPDSVDLLDGLNVPTAVAVDDRDAYFAEDGAVDPTGKSPAGAGRVGRCAIAGCGGVATPVVGYLDHPRGVAVDDASVYWTDFGPTTDPTSTTQGRVMTRPK